MTEPLRYLLDTNVLSELRVPKPDIRVLAFGSALSSGSFFVSVMTLAELHRGWALKRSSDPVKATRLAAWIDSLRIQFADHVLGIDLPTATTWAELSAQRTRPVVDTLLAATALVHNLTLVTRNTRDFTDTGVTLLNPWA